MFPLSGYSDIQSYNTSINEINSGEEYQKGIVTINGISIYVDLAIKENQKKNGLSIKDSIDSNEGMLFFFDEPQKTSFWMKNMKFPIDIIWLDESFSIVHIEKNIQTCESDLYCPTYTPNTNALYVLETIAGFSQKYNLKIGDKVLFEPLE